MKKERLFACLVIPVLFCCALFSAQCEGFHIAASEEWSWEPGSYNTFTGEIDLSAYIGTELTIQMSSDLPAEEENVKNPVFTVVDGKRITVLRQSGTAFYVPDENDSCLTFTGGIKLPVKNHIRRISFLFSVSDGSGQELNHVSYVLSAGEDGTGRTDGVFYLPVNIGIITIIFLLAAVLVWSSFLVLRRMILKNNPNGD